MREISYFCIREDTLLHRIGRLVFVLSATAESALCHFRSAFLVFVQDSGLSQKSGLEKPDSIVSRKSEVELRKIERGFYHFFCDYLVESVKLMTIKEENLRKRMVFKGTELVDKTVESGQSCVVYLGHYCNWEWISSLPLWVTPKAQCGQIYHPIENVAFDQLFLRVRQRMGSLSIPMQDTLRKILEFRKTGQPVIIGYISDQKPHWVNIHHWVNFLHHDTPVLTGTERVARKMNHAVFYLDVRRVRRGYYEAEFKLITRNPQQMREYEITDIYYQMLEATIRRAPEFWLWSHKRWSRTREEFNKRFEVIDGKVIAKKNSQ